MEQLSLDEVELVNGGLAPSPKTIAKLIAEFGDIAIGFCQGIGDGINDWAR